MIPMKSGLTAMLLTAVVASPLLASPMIVRAIGPSAEMYKPGQKLADNAQLVLRAGDQVTVLDAHGTRSFTGPQTVRLDTASAVATQTAFAELLTQKAERRARIGAVRGAAPEPVANPMPPGIWAINAAQGGTVCALDTTKLSLWRPDPVPATTINLARPGAAGVPVAFPAGVAVAPWPAEIAVADGDRFTIAGAGAAPAQITVRKIAAPPSPDVLAAALLDAGCQSQLDRLMVIAAKAAAPES